MNNFREMQERRDKLHDNTEMLAGEFLERSKDGKGFVCPCGHGSGTAKKRGQKNTGDGLTFDKNGRWHCFSCGRKGDIIDLYQYQHGIGYNEAVRDLEGLLGLAETYLPAKPKQQEKTPDEVKAEFNQLTFSPIGEPFRGLSVDTLARYGGRLYEAFRNPLKAGTYHGARRAVAFPTSDGCFFVRAVDPADNERTDRWDIGGKRPFNLEALNGGRPVFLVEGVLDALSILEAGGEAIGLSGIDGIGVFVEYLKESPFSNGILIAADNDEKGKEGAERWANAIKAVGVECKTIDTAKLYGGAKDANEALTQDREGLAHRVAEINAAELQIINPWAAGVNDLLAKIEQGSFEPVPTGIPAIDKMLGGGFSRQQLIVLMAPPAKGKTSFAQCLMETMARKTPDFTAMFFCFEMAREQLQARSISRLLREYGQDLSALDVMQGKLGWREGVKLYQQEIADKVAYFGLGSGLSSSRLEEVVGKIRDGMRYNAAVGRPAPFIVIDYLQLIDVDGKEETMAIKATMEKLKEIAVKNNTVVIAIAASNRKSNKESGGTAMDSGRGSSSIEYGADLVLSLTDTDTLEQERFTKDCKLSLVMPKGRFYDKTARADFNFFGKYSDFVQVDQFGTPVSKREDKAINDLLKL